MNTPKVSIIVPVYNSGNFLRDCLDSLLAQELSAFEILCINDGSTDDSLAILEEYGAKHPQIRVVTQKNAGVSAARNRGLSLARGEYIAFCDSDDHLLAGILAQAVKALEDCNGQLCFFEMKRVPEAYPYGGEAAAAEISVSWGLEEAVLKNQYVFLLLVSRDLIVSNEIRFREELRYSEDELFVMDLLCCVSPEKVAHLHGTGYLHRKNPGSVMNASKWHRAPRHYEAMRIFAKELQARSAPEEAVQKELHRRKLQAVSNALYDGFFMDRPPREILAELTADGLYPYPLYWESLKVANFKTMLSNHVRFLFPVRGYYLLACRIIQMGLKLYKKE